jgi:hypothetical protein
VTLFRTNIDSQLYNYLLWWQKIYVLKETCYFFDETEKMSNFEFKARTLGYIKIETHHNTVFDQHLGKRTDPGTRLTLTEKNQPIRLTA